MSGFHTMVHVLNYITLQYTDFNGTVTFLALKHILEYRNNGIASENFSIRSI